MCRNMKQRGFSLIMAIFLIVVLGGIAVFMGRVATMQYQSSALDEEGSMAYQAARTGIEWGVYQAIAPTGSGCVNSTFPLTVPTSTNSLSYTVQETCASVAATEAATTINVYKITSTATNAVGIGSEFHVERRLTATVSK